jgi:DMSO/TMAO reductase YedYZ molybdopterin-dependent catalytic subunit
MDRLVVRPYLRTHRLLPENQETPIHFLTGDVTPEELMYRRNHHPYPVLSREALTLTIAGLIDRPYAIAYDQVKAMPSRSVAMVLECSGNRRAYFRPRVYGTQWDDGAVSQGAWTGVPVRDLLAAAGLRQSAREIVFEGWDFGPRKDIPGSFPFARSLPLEVALHPDTIVAHTLNAKPLPFKHGFPLRLIVPQWYAMASVKWLRTITVIDHAFEGPYQTLDYVYYPDKFSDAGKRPVTTINVTSLIQHPRDWTTLAPGAHVIRGLAWTGSGVIERVEVSVDGGEKWEVAQFEPEPAPPYTWVRWSQPWNAAKGEFLLLARAWDSEGHFQPYQAEWNRKGYGYHAVPRVHVKVG